MINIYIYHFVAFSDSHLLCGLINTGSLERGKASSQFFEIWGNSLSPPLNRGGALQEIICKESWCFQEGKAGLLLFLIMTTCSYVSLPVWGGEVRPAARRWVARWDGSRAPACWPSVCQGSMSFPRVGKTQQKVAWPSLFVLTKKGCFLGVGTSAAEAVTLTTGGRHWWEMKEVEPELKFPCLGLFSGRPHRALQRSLKCTTQDIHHSEANSTGDTGCQSVNIRRESR